MGTPLRLRVTPSTAAAIAAAASAAALTDAAWIRAAVGTALALPASDRQPVRRYGGAGPDGAALTALRLQLHQLGGLLTQVAKVAREDGAQTRHADAEQTLAQVRAAIATVASWQAEKGAAGR